MYQHSTEILAVDFVLLPARQDIEDIIFLNKGLSQPADRQIILSKGGNLPHLSLLMGGLPIKGLDKVKEKLEVLAQSYGGFDLQIDQTVHRNDCVSLNFEKNDKLLRLHKALIKAFNWMMKTGITKEMFAADSVISNSSIKYVNSYWQQGILEDFWPHITLGYGQSVDNARVPGVMSFDKIGLYHLGNHCTCRTKIFTSALGPR